MRQWKVMCYAAALMAAILVTPAYALEYHMEGPSTGTFALSTEDNTFYEWNDPNIDKSKSAALVPPGFGTPTSYLPESGDPLTPNLTLNTLLATVAPASLTASNGTAMLPPTSIIGSENWDTAAKGYTAVTDDLYYSSGYLGTLKIPSLNVNVKVYQGTDSAQLAKGAGHFTSASIWDGNVALAGHNRGTNCYFGDIHTLDLGDTIKLTTKLGTRTYAVTSVSKISETDSSMLAATTENCITLYTCVRNESAYRWCVRAIEKRTSS